MAVDVESQSCLIINQVLKVSHTSWIYCITAIQEMLLNLTLNVWGASFLGLTISISLLLMRWLHTSPRHQQHQPPWYCLCKICRSCSYLRKDIKYLCHTNGMVPSGDKLFFIWTNVCQIISRLLSDEMWHKGLNELMTSVGHQNVKS